jgi:TonB family protein
MDATQQLNQIVDELAESQRGAHRHAFAFVASIVAHLIILIAIVMLVPEIERPHHDWVLAYLVEFDKAGATAKGAGVSDAHAGAPVASPSATRPLLSEATARLRRAAHPKAEANRDAGARLASINSKSAKLADLNSAADAAPNGAASNAAASAPEKRIDRDAMNSPSIGSAEGIRDGLGSGGAGEGDGSGSQSAHAEYGQNPIPNYPPQARRREQQGTVLLRVLVGADGAAERIEVAHSSGFNSLDDSAIETVRSRWRFIPARRDGIDIASWVEVPIRFALTEARSN